MSDMIPWMAAEGERGVPLSVEEKQIPPRAFGRVRNDKSVEEELENPQAGGSVEQLAQSQALVELREKDRERRIYRGRTVAMLRRYMKYSIETGRLPSLLGREFFRAKITKYELVTFEDRVIFVHDMETCLERLDEFSRQVLARVVLQEYDHDAAARLLGCTRMTVHRRLLEALDMLSDILVAVDLLD